METGFSYQKTYLTAWNRTLQAWPLWVIQVIFIVATWVFAVGGALAFLGTYFIRFRQDHPGFNFKDLRPDDFKSFLTPEVIGALLLLAGIFMAWLFLVGVFLKGGIYGRLWGQAAKGSFEFRGFWGDCVRSFYPLLGYQTIILGASVVLLAPVGGAIGLAMALAKGGHGALAALGMLAVGVLALLACLPVFLAGGCYLYLVLAFVTRDGKVLESFRKGWSALRADGWQALKLLGFLLALLILGMVLFGAFMGVLQLIPIVKWLAIAARLVVDLLFGALWAVYLPALTVGYLHETQPSQSPTPPNH